MVYQNIHNEEQGVILSTRSPQPNPVMQRVRSDLHGTDPRKSKELANKASLMKIDKFPLKPLDVLKLNQEVLTSEKSRHYQFHNMSYLIGRQNASQDECIAYNDIQTGYRKKVQPGKNKDDGTAEAV